jgi:ABC-type amino acid transport system permease subunit
MNLSEFYQSGGVLMHVVTLLAVVAVARIARRFRSVRAALRGPEHARARLAGADALTPAVIAAMLLAGVLGTATGLMEAAVAVGTVEPAHMLEALMRGTSILVIPVIWSTMLAIVLVLVHGVLRHAEVRIARALGVAAE